LREAPRIMRSKPAAWLAAMVLSIAAALILQALIETSRGAMMPRMTFLPTLMMRISIEAPISRASPAFLLCISK